MPCNLQETQDAACVSGIGKVVNSTKLLQIIAQLTCEAAEAAVGGGGSSSYTVETFTEEAAPFSYTATARATVEINALLAINGSGDVAGFNVARTGVPSMQIAVDATVTDFVGNYRSVSSFKLSPGDTITVTDISTGAGQAFLSQIVVYYE